MKRLDAHVAHLRKEWKTYAVAIWMIGVVFFLVHLQHRMTMLQQTCSKVDSTTDSIENILVSTDANVAHIKAQVDEMMPTLENVHTRVMRR